MLISLKPSFYITFVDNKKYNYYVRKCPDRNTSSTDVGNNEFYTYYRKKYKDDIDGNIDSKLFISIIESYNLLLQQELLAGEVVQLSSKLGKLFIQENPRKFTKTKPSTGEIFVNLRIDWGTTRKLGLINPENGKLIKQYYTEQSEYYRVYWYCTYYTRNVMSTYFNTSNTFKERITRSLEKNKTLHFKFKKNSMEFRELIDKFKQSRSKFFDWIKK